MFALNVNGLLLLVAIFVWNAEVSFYKTLTGGEPTSTFRLCSATFVSTVGGLAQDYVIVSPLRAVACGGAGGAAAPPGIFGGQLNFSHLQSNISVLWQDAFIKITSCMSILSKSKCTFEIDWTLNAQPYLTQKTEMLSIVQKALCKINGQEARIDNGGGTSDGRWVAPSGSEVIELGPRNQTIHKIDEKISLADLERLQEIYQQILVETNNQVIS